jgi:hypothetical protein
MSTQIKKRIDHLMDGARVDGSFFIFSPFEQHKGFQELTMPGFRYVLIAKAHTGFLATAPDYPTAVRVSREGLRRRSTGTME